MSSMKDICKSINKAWKDDVLSSGNFVKEIKKLSFGSLGFDYPLYGGLPYGQICVMSGAAHSGKTTAACIAMARYQKENPDRVCVYVDAEQTLLTQATYLQKITGISYDPSCFMRYDCSGKSAEEIFQDILKMQEADDIGMIILDSIVGLIPAADLDNDFVKDNGLRGSIAKVAFKWIKQMVMYLPKRNNILLVINQVRVEPGFGGSIIYKEPCGSAFDFFPSVKIRFGTRTFTQGDKVDISPSKGEGSDGFRLKFSLVKNRLGPMNRGGGFCTVRLATGIDVIGDMLEIALKFGFIQRPTVQSYTLLNLDNNEVYKDAETNEDLKFIGKQKLMNYLYSHKDFLDQYTEMLTRHISEASSDISLLNEKDLKEIIDQEKALSPDTYIDTNNEDELEETV